MRNHIKLNINRRRNFQAIQWKIINKKYEYFSNEDQIKNARFQNKIIPHINDQIMMTQIRDSYNSR